MQKYSGWAVLVSAERKNGFFMLFTLAIAIGRAKLF